MYIRGLIQMENQKQKYKDNKGCLAGIVIFIIIIWLTKHFSTSFNAFIVGVILFIGVIACVIANNTKKMNDRLEKEKETIIMNNTIFNMKLKELNLSESNLKIFYKSGYAKIQHGFKYIWKDEDDNLCFLPANVIDSENKYIIYKIPLKDIEYFYTQNKDLGETYINYFVNDVKHSMFFDFNDYDVLQKLIPEKEANYVNKKILQRKFGSIIKTSNEKKKMLLAMIK